MHGRGTEAGTHKFGRIFPELLHKISYLDITRFTVVTAAPMTVEIYSICSHSQLRLGHAFRCIYVDQISVLFKFIQSPLNSVLRKDLNLWGPAVQ